MQTVDSHDSWRNEAMKYRKFESPGEMHGSFVSRQPMTWNWPSMLHMQPWRWRTPGGAFSMRRKGRSAQGLTHLSKRFGTHTNASICFQSARIWQVHHSYMQHNVHIVLQLLQVDGKANQQCRVICFTFLVQDVQVSRTLHSGERSPNHQRCGTYSRTSRGTAVWDSTDSTDLFLYPKKQRIFMDFLYFLKNLPGTFNDLVTDYTRDTQNGVDVSGKMALPVAGWRTAELLCISISIGIGGMANAGTQCRDGSWIWEVQEDSDLEVENLVLEDT